MTLLLRHEDLAGLLSIEQSIAAVRAGLAEQAAGQVQVPPRITIDSAAGFGWLRMMPAILNGSGVMGYKAMHSTPGVGVRYLVALYDLRTGALLAQLDGDWLTQQRTAATAAVATDLLARPDAARVGLLGSSEQARTLLIALAAVRRFEQVQVYSPSAAHREAFADAMNRQLSCPVVAVESAEAAVRDADLVGSAIRAGSAPVLRAAWLAPGAHVNAISSVRPEARELEEAVWRAGVAVVDEREHAFESGDGVAALVSGVRRDDVAELWEVPAGQRPGRTHADQITLFKSVGFALLDLSLAAALYARARARGLGQEIGDFPHPRL